MKGNKVNVGRAVTMTREHWDVPLRVRVRPYMEFNFRLENQLQRLVARWARPAKIDPPPFLPRRF